MAHPYANQASASQDALTKRVAGSSKALAAVQAPAHQTAGPKSVAGFAREQKKHDNGYKAGGAVKKGATTVNVVIAPQGGGAPGGLPPMPMPPPGGPGGPPPMPPAPPQMGMPMPNSGPRAPIPMRKRGGEVGDLTAGAGSGLGRLQKAAKVGNSP